MDQCPRDQLALTDLTLEGQRVRHCMRCTGLWLPGVAVESAFGKRVKPDPVETAVPIPCPDDGASLVAIRQRGVEIDICPECGGVWLDPGEWKKIQTHRKSGQPTGSQSPHPADNPSGTPLELIAGVSFATDPISGAADLGQAAANLADASADAGSSAFDAIGDIFSIF